MATVSVLYTSQRTVTFSSRLRGLANSSVNSIASAEVQNTTTKYLDALVFVKVRAGTAAVGSDKAVYLYAYGWNGTTGTSAKYTGGVVGTSASTITLKQPSVLKPLGVIPVPVTNSTYYAGPFSVANSFGGELPGRWGVVVNNFAGPKLSTVAVSHSVTYVGVQATVV